MGYEYGDLKSYSAIYDPQKMRDGFNEIDGEKVFFISNPAVGLWAAKERFEGSDGK